MTGVNNRHLKCLAHSSGEAAGIARLPVNSHTIRTLGQHGASGFRSVLTAGRLLGYCYSGRGLGGSSSGHQQSLLEEGSSPPPLSITSCSCTTSLELDYGQMAGNIGQLLLQSPEALGHRGNRTKGSLRRESPGDHLVQL